MEYKEKEKRVEMFQISATNFDRLCEFLGYTPEQIVNPVFGIDEYGNTRDFILGVWIKIRPNTSDDDKARAYLGDCVIRNGNGFYEVMNPWDFAEKYEKV